MGLWVGSGGEVPERAVVAMLANGWKLPHITEANALRSPGDH